jgi:hypothetical protein
MRVEHAVAHELDRRPVKDIGARLRRDVDQRRRLPTEFGWILRFLNLELLNRVRRQADHHVIEVLVGDLHPIKEVDVVATSLAGDVEERARLLQCGAACAAGRHHNVVGELRELEELPAVQRQPRNPGIGDDVGNLGVCRLKRRNFCHYRHGFREPTNVEHDIHRDGTTELRDDAFLDRPFESRQFNRDDVLADGQRGQHESAVLIRDALDPLTAGKVLGGDEGSRKDTALSIAHRADDFRRVGLSEGSMLGAQQ